MTKTLLITDDALLMRVIIRDVATQNGWHVVGEASNGQQAIEEYQRTKPSAVTLDLVMPGFDGLHALRGIRRHDPAAKIIVVSALNQQNVLEQAVAEGAADFVCKPFDRDNLADALERLPVETVAAE
ncbi:MAG: response regulator [Pirellulales bacterium]|nr:response regulator [Pirellulales bacterium]